MATAAAAWLAVLLLPACAGSTGRAAGDGGAQPLTTLPVGTAWHLAEAPIAALQLPGAEAITLRFEPGRISGHTGCNGYQAGLRLDADGHVQLDPIGRTKRGCPAPAGQIEQAWFSALSRWQSLARDGDTLWLQLADGARLRFVPVEATP